MGKVWCTDVPAILKKAGVDFKINPGAEVTSRRSGGFEALLGVVNHHDASGEGSNDANALRWATQTSPDRPIGNTRINRHGVITVIAFGAANTQGKGGPLRTSKGYVPLNDGNRWMWANEYANNGVGEPWPKVQIEAGLAFDDEFAKWYGLDPMTDFFEHAGYCAPSCPGRKIDRRGPTPSHPSLGGSRLDRLVIWPEGAWGQLILARRKSSAPPSGPKPSEPTRTYTVRSGDGWARIASNLGLSQDTATYTKLQQQLQASKGRTTPWPGDVLTNAGISAPSNPAPVTPPKPKHTIKALPEGMDSKPGPNNPAGWHESEYPNHTRWLKTFFKEQGWWNGDTSEYWTLEFQEAVAFVQRQFRDWTPPESPNRLVYTNGWWMQETAEKIDAWARQQPWYASVK